MNLRNKPATTSTDQTTGRRRARTAVLLGAVAAVPLIGVVAANSASAASVSTWEKVAQCESTGNWSINTGNGFYGGLQFTPSTWAAYGGTAYAASADQATEAQQISVAEKVLADQGPGAWPVCSVQAGLTAGGAPASVDTSSASSASSASTSSAAQTQTQTQAPVQQQSAPVQQSAPAQAPAQQQSAPAQGGSQHHRHGANQGGGSYTVQAGDTLSSIAAAHGTDWASLYAKNTSVIGGNPDVIYPGQTITL
ncbi:transglycosylase family protein [Kitasatospora viridis]|uniref:LysM domain-containing protein n=1 Tax=Kitasatospora viridis TaxID=281105 RepID=A0A561UII2_9ACTN|nr:transglycosylase family protein [Kitasatospora viridis]TWF99183.1 LysM domain-containing protein [Kitasatospora viridis]